MNEVFHRLRGALGDRCRLERVLNEIATGTEFASGERTPLFDISECEPALPHVEDDVSRGRVARGCPGGSPERRMQMIAECSMQIAERRLSVRSSGDAFVNRQSPLVVHPSILPSVYPAIPWIIVGATTLLA